MQAIVRAAPNLQSIHLEGVDELTDDGIAALGELRLRDLSLVFTLTGSPQVSEATLLHVLGGCAGGDGLQTLELSERAGPPLALSAHGTSFMQVLSRHWSLKMLTLSGVVGLGDAALRMLASSCRNLRELSLYRPGHQLTSAGLVEGLRQLSRLECLSLGCVADFPGAFEAICNAGCELKSFEMTRYFRTAADMPLVSVLKKIRGGFFHSLRLATFRGTFSYEQVSACYDEMTQNPQGMADASWTQLDDQTFSVQWPTPVEAACLRVQLQRCFKESEFV